MRSLMNRKVVSIGHNRRKNVDARLSTPFEQHVERIKQVDASIRDNVLLKANYIVKAIDDLGDGLAKDLATQIGMDKGQLSRWQAIGRSSFIKMNQSQMPSAMGTLYNITLLISAYDNHFGRGQGEKRVQQLLDSEQIAPTSARSVIDGLLLRVQKLITKKKSKETEKKLERLRPTTEIKTPRKLDDFIKAGSLFHTIVVVPTKNQITSWSKLDFAIDIGDAYAIQDIRKTTQVAPVFCFLMIERGKLPIGVKCLEGWGFNYKDYIAMQEHIVLIAVRGISGDINVSADIKTIDELCTYAEKVSSAPNILIGDTTNRDDWCSCNG